MADGFFYMIPPGGWKHCLKEHVPFAFGTKVQNWDNKGKDLPPEFVKALNEVVENHGEVPKGATLNFEERHYG